jgi:hypothetical protein
MKFQRRPGSNAGVDELLGFGRIRCRYRLMGLVIFKFALTKLPN